MNEIICPNCNTAFKIDEIGFDAILKKLGPISDEEFNYYMNK